MKDRSVTSIYRRDEVIGRGNFGVVYKGVNLETRQVVAIKALDLDTVNDEVEDVQHEVSLLAQLSKAENSNVTKYFGSYLVGTKLWIIMDLCAGGSVRTLLKAGPLEERYLSVIFREMMIALAHIHREGVIHRDIKAANVLITTAGQLRLCDFGVAVDASISRNKRNTIVGTPYWMAPEVIIEGASYTNKADIWSLGITMYEIATGNPPYSDVEALRALMMISKNRPPRLEGHNYSSSLKDLVALCLDEAPNERPAAEELYKHKFIKQWLKTPTTVLRDLVTRYRQWKEKNASARDSMLLFNPSQFEKINALDDWTEFADPNDDSMWDFDMEDNAVEYPPPPPPVSHSDLSDAPPSLQELFPDAVSAAGTNPVQVPAHLAPHSMAAQAAQIAMPPPQQAASNPYFQHPATQSQPQLQPGLQINTQAHIPGQLQPLHAVQSQPSLPSQRSPQVAGPPASGSSPMVAAPPVVTQPPLVTPTEKRFMPALQSPAIPPVPPVPSYAASPALSVSDKGGPEPPRMGNAISAGSRTRATSVTGVGAVRHGFHRVDSQPSLSQGKPPSLLSRTGSVHRPPPQPLNTQGSSLSASAVASLGSSGLASPINVVPVTPLQGRVPSGSISSGAPIKPTPPQVLPSTINAVPPSVSGHSPPAPQQNMAPRPSNAKLEPQKFPHTQPLPTKTSRTNSVSSGAVWPNIPSAATSQASIATNGMTGARRSPSPRRQATHGADSPVRRKTSDADQSGMQLVLPGTNIPARPRNEKFPATPTLNLNVLLDTTPFNEVEQQMQTMLASFGEALKCIGARLNDETVFRAA